MQLNSIPRSKWYIKFQNNSGGYYYKNKVISPEIAIEARSLMQAEEIFNKLDKKENDWCECCGSRWKDTWYSVMDSEPCVVLSPSHRTMVKYHLNGKVSYIGYDGNCTTDGGLYSLRREC